MSPEKRKRIREVLAEIQLDMAKDAHNFDGQPFNGRTVATYLGNLGAAVEAVARAVDALFADMESAS